MNTFAETLRSRLWGKPTTLRLFFSAAPTWLLRRGTPIPHSRFTTFGSGLVGQNATGAVWGGMGEGGRRRFNDSPQPVLVGGGFGGMLVGRCWRFGRLRLTVLGGIGGGGAGIVQGRGAGTGEPLTAYGAGGPQLFALVGGDLRFGGRSGFVLGLYAGYGRLMFGNARERAGVRVILGIETTDYDNS